MKFIEKLEQLNACYGALAWVGSRTLTKAWNECPRGDWLLWLAAKADVDRRLVVEAACRCAEASLGFVAEGENRPIEAVATARRWIIGEATLEEVRHAADAADAAAASAAYAACASADAAYAAAYAADAAADAADAACAADAAYAADARSAALADCADIVRQVITVADVAAALRVW